MEQKFSEVLKSLMKRDRLTQVQVAEGLKVRQSQVSNWLNDKSLPTYASIKSMCLFFSVSADKILSLEGETE